jgi:lipoprotein-releasing system ATP-binding protein
VADAPAVVRLTHVKKTYGIDTPTAVEVLHGIDLTLQRGEFVALTGPSGSGKSTLLNIIGLLDRPTSGQLFIGNQETGTLDEAQLTALRGHSIGFIFQAHCLISAFTALENVMIPQLAESVFPNDAMRLRSEELLDQVELTKWKDNLVSNLSGGQQQRVAIARSLAMKPALILADEPTGNLDSKSADTVIEMMREVNRTDGTTFLIVTHNMDIAARCDRNIEVVDGRIVQGVTDKVIK